MGTVALPGTWHGIAVTTKSIISVHVVDDTVVVVIHTIGRNFSRVYPHIRRKIGMGIINPLIDHCDNQVRTPG